MATSPQRHYFKDVPYIRESDYLLLVSANLKLRDRLLAVAKECAECGGTGCVEDVVDHALFGPQVQTVACENCADIREVLE